MIYGKPAGGQSVLCSFDSYHYLGIVMEFLLTASDVAQRLNINVDSVSKFISQEELPAIMMGGQWRFPESQVQRWIEERRLVRH